MRREQVAYQEKLGPNPEIWYTRKSMESADMQTRSHAQQVQSIREQVATKEPVAQFKDDKSGKTFDDRVGFQQMLQWCRAHPQPRSAPGRILMYDKSRFGRALIPGTDETDWLAYDKARIAFAEIGWELHFVKSVATGNKVVDRIMDTIEDEQSSDYVRRLSANVKRGQTDITKNGYWARGKVPFPCVRVDARSGKVLEDALRDASGTVVRGPDGQTVRPSERVQPGARVVLAGDPERVKHWNHGARMLLEGRSWGEVLNYFDGHVRTASGYTRWSHAALQKVYTNEALVGWLVRELDGSTQRIKAQWEPVVDPELFYRVSAEVRARQLRDGTPRSPEATYLLRTVFCAHCGVKYVGGRRGGPEYGKKRYYSHPRPTDPSRMDRTTHALAVEHGCRSYRIPADFLELQVRDLILAERRSENWAATMQALYREAMSGTGAAQDYLATCERSLRERRTELENLLTALGKATGAAQDIVLGKINEKQREIDDAVHEVRAATERLASVGDLQQEALATLEETAAIVQAWSNQDTTAQQRVMDWWVEGIAVVVEEVPGRFQGEVLQKTCQIWLKTAPAGYELVIPGSIRGAQETSIHSSFLCLPDPISAQVLAKQRVSYTITVPGTLREASSARPTAEYPRALEAGSK